MNIHYILRFNEWRKNHNSIIIKKVKNDIHKYSRKNGWVMFELNLLPAGINFNPLKQII